MTLVLIDTTFLLEEKRIHMRDKQKEGKRECNPKVGNIVKLHIQVQSISKQGIADKLSYRAKDQLFMTADLVHNSLEVQRYDNLASFKFKYKIINYIYSHLLYSHQTILPPLTNGISTVNMHLYSIP